MSATLTINLARAIKSATISGCAAASPAGAPGAYDANSGSGSAQLTEQELNDGRAVFSQVNGALKGAADKLNDFCDKAFAGHKEEIAKLSVEIARKILVQKVEDGDYEIESIIKEALDNAPARQDVVVHLNPEDLSQYQKLREEDPSEDLTGIKFVPDANIGRAECLLETPKGIIESLIDRHLEQIGSALKKVK